MHSMRSHVVMFLGGCTGRFSAAYEALECDQCAKGQYQAAHSGSACVDCPAAFYSGTLAAVYCNACPRNFFQSDTGRSECSRCPSGQYSEMDSTQQAEGCLLCSSIVMTDVSVDSCQTCNGQDSNASFSGVGGVAF